MCSPRDTVSLAGSKRRNALTLVEVVCALSLLAVTATLLLTAQARSLDQLRHVEKRRQAAELASQLVDRWRLENTLVTVEDEGWLGDGSEWSWKRTVRQRSDTDLWEVHLIIERRQLDRSKCIVAEYVWLEYAHDT